MALIRQDVPALDRLRDISLFRGCDERELRLIDRLACHQEVAQGAELCRQGSVGRQVFVIESGQAAVCIDDAVVARLGRGSFFGEMSVLDNNDRVATVTALTSMSVLVLNPAEFHQLLNDVPRVAQRMLATVGGRLRLANRALSPAPGRHVRSR